MLRIFRDVYNVVPESPRRFLYGHKNDPSVLLAPLDLCMDPRQAFPSLPPGGLVGADVLLTGGTPIGTVSLYQVPGPSGLVHPIVEITSNGAVNAVEPGVAAPPNGGIQGKRIEMLIDATAFQGTVVSNAPQQQGYLTAAHRVMAYEVQFDNVGITERNHGARVYFLDGGHKLLLGMLIATQDRDALVFPAHLI